MLDFLLVHLLLVLDEFFRHSAYFLPHGAYLLVLAPKEQLALFILLAVHKRNLQL